MAVNQEVSDSTDWLQTPLGGLTALEAALRCQMCKDFYKTPMLTSCSHTFCSLCIRHALANDGRCPLCRKTGQENQLRNNWSLEEAVDSFSKTRKALLDFARSDARQQPSRSPKRKQVATDEASPGPARKRLRSSARLNNAKSQSPGLTEAREDLVVQDSEDEQEVQDDEDDNDESFVPEDGLVPCPVCQTRMKQWQVFRHLDTCTGAPPTTKPTEDASTSSRTHGSLSTQLRYSPPSKPPERLAGLSYGLLKDNQLRKKLSDLGLSSTGPRQLLENRHREWVTIWNANCDSAKPKMRAALVQDLASWERTIGLGASNSLGNFARSRPTEPEIKDKNFNGAAWAIKHDDIFKDLIADARKTRAKAQGKKDEAASLPPAGAEAGVSSALISPAEVAVQGMAVQAGSTMREEHLGNDDVHPELISGTPVVSIPRYPVSGSQETQRLQPPSDRGVPPLQGNPTERS